MCCKRNCYLENIERFLFSTYFKWSNWKDPSNLCYLDATCFIEISSRYVLRSHTKTFDKNHSWANLLRFVLLSMNWNCFPLQEPSLCVFFSFSFSCRCYCIVILRGSLFLRVYCRYVLCSWKLVFKAFTWNWIFAREIEPANIGRPL